MTDADITPYGKTGAGAETHQITLSNPRGMIVRLLDYGGIITEILAPDRAGTVANVVLGCRTIADYETKSPYFGAMVGRFSNRIARATFSLDGKTFALPANDGPNTLHGGTKGGETPNFSHRVWDIVDASHSAVILRLQSPDGDNGFPGALTVDITCALGADNTFTIDYTARVEGRATVLNLTNHSYFNLSGADSALDHVVTIPALQYLPADAGQIPTGALDPVENTPMDFRRPMPVRARIGADFEQLALAKGYDHCFVLDKPAGQSGLAAHIHDPVSGRTLTIETTEPAVQFYAGNKLDGQAIGTGGVPYKPGDGLAFETQHFPDSPNQPHFPSTRLDPGTIFRSNTTWRFGIDTSAQHTDQ